MKVTTLIALSVALISLKLSNGYDFIKNSQNSTTAQMCLNVHNIGSDRDAIVFLAKDASEAWWRYMETCYNRIPGNSTIIHLNFEYGKNILMYDGMLQKVMQINYNIMVFTLTLTDKIWKQKTIKTVLRNKRNIMFLMLLTEEERYKCVKGKFQDKTIIEIDDFLNDFWRKSKVLNVILYMPFSCKDVVLIFDDKYSTSTKRHMTTVDAHNHEQLGLLLKQNVGHLIKVYPFRAHITNHFPFSIRECEASKKYVDVSNNFSAGYCGPDGMIMNDIVKYLNLNLDYVTSKPHAHGYMMPNGTIIGSLATVINDEVDMSFISRFMLGYIYDERMSNPGFTFMHFVGRDSVCAYLPWTDSVPLWHFPVSPFRAPLWLLIFGALAVTGLAEWALTRVASASGLHQKPHRIHTYIIHTIASGLFGVVLRKKPKFLWIRGFVTCSSIIFLAMYQGNINHVFTTELKYPPLRTLEDIEKSGVSLYTSFSVKVLLLISEYEKDIRLTRNIQLWPSETNSNLEFVISTPNTAGIQRQSNIMMTIQRYYHEKNEEPKLYLVDECYRTYLLSYIVNDAFPFKRELKMIVTRLCESGLPTMYYRWTRRALGLLDINTVPFVSKPRLIYSIPLSELRLPFAILFGGSLLSAITLVVEIWWAHRCGNQSSRPHAT